MQNIDFTDVRGHLTEISNQVAYTKERMVLNKHGKEFIALVPMDDLHLLEALEEKLDLADYRKALKNLAQEELVSLEEAKVELGLK